MPAGSEQITIRWILLVVTLGVELIGLTASYEAPALSPLHSANDARWSAWLFHVSREMWPAVLWIAGTCLLILTPRLQPILFGLREQSSGYRWWIWLACHALAFAAFGVLTGLIFERPTDPARLSAPWFTAWLVLATATFLLWLLAVAPSRSWWRLVRQERMTLLGGCLLGACAWQLVRFAGPLAREEPWTLLAEPTLRLVYSLLGWVYSDVVYQPEIFVVGTAAFQVEIFSPCSGYEGITLITLFLAGYLWLFRQELRFPQALWLFPLGIIAIWLANAVRIAALIAVGTSFSPEVALGGFHAQAGWVAFTLIALGAIALSHRVGFFTVTAARAPLVANSGRLAAALIVPLLALMAASMVTSAASGGWDLLYPLRVLATAAALWYFRGLYRGLGWACSGYAVATGIVVFLIWMLLEPDSESSGTTALSQGLAELPGWASSVWVAFRVLGSIITVPLAEELAFRGYLLRKLVAEDFESVPLGRFTWLALIVSSIVFGALHGRWLAGTLAGMGYALVLCRRGQLGDAVVAHATSNALIAVWVLAWGRWSLWS